MLRMTGLCLGLLLAPAALARTASAPGAEVYFITPQDGEIVTSPVTVRFGLRNMGVAPAGVQVENTGHHHLLIDTWLPPLDQPVPSDDRHLHFGKGQTETVIELSPGEHTLQLLLGDYAHIPHEPPVASDKITITVE
jgi:hypothetical protein